MAADDAGEAPPEATRYRRLAPAWRAVLISVGLTAIFLALNQIMNLGFFVGEVMLDTQYLYALCALLAGCVFILVPAGKSAQRDHVPWYDAALFFANIAVFGYFALNAHRIIREGWEFAAPEQAIWVAYVGWLVLLEATRRAGGTAVFVVVTLFSLYPVFAGHMPGPISGLPQPLSTTAA
jgi:TRAP-type uncharacterized transport system fused permease subunit